jgi:DivIVA domain-containing protein
VALDRHSIEKKDFPVGERGYDPDAVDAHLAAVADEVTAFKQEARRRSDTMASSASERVRSIIEAAEHSASEIQRAAEEDARETREEANHEADGTREDAHREAREHLEKVSASTSAMIDRLRAMEQEMNAMIETVRTGSNRLSADLQELQSGLGEVSSSLSPRSRFQSDEPAPVAQAGDLQQPQSHEHFQPQSDEHSQPPAAKPPVEPAGVPEAAELLSVAGELGHAEGSDAAEAPDEGSDAEGARLIALNMALNGAPREETERYLSENFHLADARGVLDEVYASVEG